MRDKCQETKLKLKPRVICKGMNCYVFQFVFVQVKAIKKQMEIFDGKHSQGKK